jgi:hypothetical protein
MAATRAFIYTRPEPLPQSSWKGKYQEQRINTCRWLKMSILLLSTEKAQMITTCFKTLFFYMTDTLLRVVLDAHASPGPERDASGRRVLDIGHLERRRNSSHAELAVVLLLMRNGQSLSLGRGQIATEEYSRAFISGK